MNLEYKEGLQLIQKVNDYFDQKNVNHLEVIMAPPFLYIPEGAQMASSKRVSIAGQNCSEHAAGAFTGEVSAAMLRSAGAELVIIGHSERRQHFQEGHQQLAAKIHQAWEANLMPIFCVGENLEQRKAKKYFATVEEQLHKALGEFSGENLSNIIIAYEPVWAIGTGESATASQVQEMHQHIRYTLAEMQDSLLAQEVSILYGGSLKPGNARELFEQPDVDGGLIGGASITFKDFSQLIEIGEKCLR